jgi:membrane protein
MIFGQPRSLDQISIVLLYIVGVSGEMLLLTAIYFIMPVGRLSLRHALIGGATATLLWEMMRHILAWYYTTMSEIQLVYGSLTTAIAVLLSVEIGALVLLIGAQVIAEYERISREPIDVAGHNETRRPLNATKYQLRGRGPSDVGPLNWSAGPSRVGSLLSDLARVS